MTNLINTFAHILEASTAGVENEVPAEATATEATADLAAETAAAIEAIPERLEAGEVFVDPPKDMDGIMLTEEPAAPKKRKTLSLAPVMTDDEKAAAAAEAKPAKGKGKGKAKGLDVLAAAGRMDFDPMKVRKPAKAKAEKPAKEPKPAKAPKEPKPAKEPRETKVSQLIEMLQSKTGATGKELQEMFGWLPHTTRGAISTLHRKSAFPAGHKVERTQEEGRGSVYRIVKTEEGQG